MGDSSVKHTYYENMKGLIDPAFFVVTGFFGLEKLRSVEFINGPMTHQAMALAGAVNGLTIYLANRMGQAGENDSPYYKAMLTIVGLTAGALLTPYVVSRVMKSHAVLITPEMSFRIAAFNLVAKVVIYVTFTKAEQYYNRWNFPAFQNFDEMTEHTVRMLYDHFKDHADLWKKESFKKQLGFNQALLKYGLDPLSITEIDLDTSLTKGELKTFRELFEKGNLTPQQATLLYNFHVPPQENRVYSAKHLPIIDPRTIKEIDRLSDEQIQWHHQWFIAHPALTIPECQIQAFVPRFYQLGLVPPYKEFVAELPIPTAKEALTKEQVSYLAHFYQAKRYKWDALELPQQIVLRAFFTKHGFDAHPLRDPTIEQMNVLDKKDLKEFRKRFKTEESAWASKSSTYQEAFNEALSRKGLEELEIPAQPWTTKQKVAVVCLVILGAAFIGGGIFMLRNRAVQVGPQTDQRETNNDICIGDECPPTQEVPSCVEGPCLETPDSESTFVDLRNASLEESDHNTTPISPVLDETDGKPPEHIETGGSDQETLDTGSTFVDLRNASLEESDHNTTPLHTELEETDRKTSEHVETGGSDLETPDSGSTLVDLESSGDGKGASGVVSDQSEAQLNLENEEIDQKPQKPVIGADLPYDLEPESQTIRLSTDPNDYVDTGSRTVLKTEFDQVCNLSDLFFGRVSDVHGGMDVVLKDTHEASLEGRVEAGGSEQKTSGSGFTSADLESSGGGKGASGTDQKPQKPVVGADLPSDLEPKAQTTSFSADPNDYVDVGTRTVLKTEEEQIKYPTETLPERNIFDLSEVGTQGLEDLSNQRDSILPGSDAESTTHSDQVLPADPSPDSQPTNLPLGGMTGDLQKENNGVIVGETDSSDDSRLTQPEVGLGATGETQKENDGVVVGETGSSDDPRLTESEVWLGTTGETKKESDEVVVGEMDSSGDPKRIETEVRTDVPGNKFDKTSEKPTSTNYWKLGIGGGSLLLAFAYGLWKKVKGSKDQKPTSFTPHPIRIGNATLDVHSSPSKKKPVRPILRERREGRSSERRAQSASRVLFAPEEGVKVDFKDAIGKIAAINPQSIPELEPIFHDYVQIQRPVGKPFIEYKDKARYSGEEDAVISIIPDRFLGVQVKRGPLEKGSFFSLLDEFIGQNHALHYIDIDAKRIEASDSELSGEPAVHLAGEECLSRISSYQANNSVEVLRLSGFEKITVSQLNKIMQKFPRVMHFDLRGSKVEVEVIEAFQEDYILETDDFSNVGAQFERCWKGIRERRERFVLNSDIRELQDLFNPHADLASHLRKHPLGPYRFFVDNVWFLHGLKIDDDYMNETVLPNLHKNFPNARALDLSGCERLTSNTLNHMAKATFRIESLILRDCPRIFSRYRSSGSSVATEPVCDITAVGNVVNSFKELVKFISYVDLRGSAVLDPFGVDEEELPRDKIVEEAKGIAVEKHSAEKYWNRCVTDALEKLYPTGKEERSSYWSNQGKRFWFLDLLYLFSGAQQASTCRLACVMYNLKGKDSDQKIG